MLEHFVQLQLEHIVQVQVACLFEPVNLLVRWERVMRRTRGRSLDLGWRISGLLGVLFRLKVDEAAVHAILGLEIFKAALHIFVRQHVHVFLRLLRTSALSLCAWTLALRCARHAGG